jgi:hypothetical protein
MCHGVERAAVRRSLLRPLASAIPSDSVWAQCIIG